MVFSTNIHGELYITDKQNTNKILVLLTKSLIKQKGIRNFFIGSTNRFVGKTENLLGQQKILSVLHQQSVRLIQQFFFPVYAQILQYNDCHNISNRNARI